MTDNELLEELEKGRDPQEEIQNLKRVIQDALELLEEGDYKAARHILERA